MGTCVNHPDRKTNFQCMKHGVYLCEECLECRDPELFCKFRPSCPIWFLTKRAAGLDEPAKPKTDAVTDEYQVSFATDKKSVQVPAGTTLLDAARKADVHVNASCNGKGACGKCKLKVTSGEADAPSTPLLSEAEQKKGYVLACQAKVTGDVTVDIPPEIMERKLKAAGMGQEVTEKLKGLVTQPDPLLKEVALELSPPSLEDSVSDLDRLTRGLKKKGWDATRLNVGLNVMRQLAESIRRENWALTASVIGRKCSNEILEVRPGREAKPSYGLAVDLGTTTIVAYLVDMADGTVLAAASDHNRQAACGDDVINRIVCAEKEGVKKLSRMVLSTINDLLVQVLDGAGVQKEGVKNVVVSGNTTMSHLFLGIEPRYIRREPYIPTLTEFPVLKAGEVGLKTDKNAAVFIMPGPASYVGGDIVSGVLYTGFNKKEELTLFLDVGTNGEIVLGNRDWLMTAACSAGPAFEGGGVRWGMRAEEGAIEKVVIDADTLEPTWSTVGDQPPRGICGSAMIDLISELLRVGAIDPRGKFQNDSSHPRLDSIRDEPVYIVALADQTPMKENIVFGEADIKNLIYSKAAVYAGLSTLIKEAGLDFSMVDKVIIAGGFGQYLDMEKAVTIGLLPDMARAKFTYMGNTSIAGAYMALLSGRHRQEAVEICQNMTYLDFSSNSRYMDEFTSAMFLPHTNLEMFPSVTAHG